MPAGAKKPVYAPYIEHVPPDVTARISWLKNRDPARWREAQQLEHVLGKYVISDRPMTEEEWTRERATVIDVTQESEDGAIIKALQRCRTEINLGPTAVLRPGAVRSFTVVPSSILRRNTSVATAPVQIPQAYHGYFYLSYFPTRLSVSQRQIPAMILARMAPRKCGEF